MLIYLDRFAWEKGCAHPLESELTAGYITLLRKRNLKFIREIQALLLLDYTC